MAIGSMTIGSGGSRAANSGSDRSRRKRRRHPRAPQRQHHHGSHEARPQPPSTGLRATGRTPSIVRPHSRGHAPRSRATAPRRAACLSRDRAGRVQPLQPVLDSLTRRNSRDLTSALRNSKKTRDGGEIVVLRCWPARRHTAAFRVTESMASHSISARSPAPTVSVEQDCHARSCSGFLIDRRRSPRRHGRRQPPDHPHEPASEPLGVPQLAEAPMCLRERVLGHVLGILAVAQDGKGDQNASRDDSTSRASNSRSELLVRVTTSPAKRPVHSCIGARVRRRHAVARRLVQ